MHRLLAVGDYLPDVHCPLVKVTGYLLSPDPRVDGQGKRAFFEAFGFKREHPGALISALEIHGVENPVVRCRKDEWGFYWECSGPLKCPNGREPTVKTVWILRPGQEIPSLVTAVPD
ncbi:DUF6883 domain-containing protein [Methylobacterium terrae]|uniref:DUF6883 domain-containing protein n=1 Tax=Methylobacterium terrae TaxID=2202827 RepID=UPI0013A53429|nr:DUF6883 domain-containing protein [Methylobacterium terrae]